MSVSSRCKPSLLPVYLQSSILESGRLPMFRSQEPALSLSDLTENDVEQLSHVLSKPLWAIGVEARPERTLWRERQDAIARLVGDLPSHLRRPIPMQTSVVDFFERHTYYIPSACRLCQSHSRLNSQLIQDILAYVQAEVGNRLNPLAQSISLFSSPHQALVNDLRALHALWLPPADYRIYFLREPTPRWSFQPDRCGACILARIGEHVETLILLRTTLLARQKRHLDDPRLLRWVEGWIAWSSPGEDLVIESDSRARSLRQAKKFVRKPSRPCPMTETEKHEADISATETLAETQPENREDKSSTTSNEENFEESIIDSYVPGPLRYTTSPTKRIGHDRADLLSRHDGVPTTDINVLRARKSASSQARGYQDLLGENFRFRSPDDCGSSVYTKWSDFI